MEAKLMDGIKEQLVARVGLRLKPYRCTAGKLRQNGILMEIRKPRGRRSARYLFKELFEIVG